MKPEVDDLDRAIVECLIEDPRMRGAEVARQLGYVSPRTATNRIGSLLETGIIRISAGARPRPLAYTIVAEIAVETQTRKARPGLRLMV